MPHLSDLLLLLLPLSTVLPGCEGPQQPAPAVATSCGSRTFMFMPSLCSCAHLNPLPLCVSKKVGSLGPVVADALEPKTVTIAGADTSYKLAACVSHTLQGPVWRRQRATAKGLMNRAATRHAGWCVPTQCCVMTFHAVCHVLLLLPLLLT